LTPKESEELFEMLGNRAPSKSTLDRLPKALNAHWEAQRISFETQLRDEESVPAEAVSIGISLDGVMVPMKDGDRKGKRRFVTGTLRIDLARLPRSRTDRMAT
jgi:hypothetical protein